MLLVVAVFNACLRLGYFPDQWKLSKVICVCKPGKPPAVVTSMLLPYFRDHIEERAVIPSCEYGLQPGKWRVHQLYHVTRLVRAEMSQRKSVGMLCRKKLQIHQNKILKLMLNKPRCFPTTRLHALVEVDMINDYLSRLSEKFVLSCRRNINDDIVGLVDPIWTFGSCAQRFTSFRLQHSITNGNSLARLNYVSWLSWDRGWGGLRQISDIVLFVLVAKFDSPSFSSSF